MDSFFSRLRKQLRHGLDKKYEKKISIAFSCPPPSSSKLIIRVTSDDLNRSYRVPDSYDKILKTCISNARKKELLNLASRNLRFQNQSHKYKLASKNIIQS